MLVVALPWGLNVTAALLGTSWPIEGLERDARLHLPRARRPASDGAAPGIDAPAVPTMGIGQPLVTGVRWGLPTSWSPQRRVQQAAIRSAVVLTTLSDGSPGERWRRGEGARELVELWLVRLIEWLEVFTDIDAYGAPTRSALGLLDTTIVDLDAPDGVYAMVAANAEHRNGPGAVGSKWWREAVARTNRSQPPPTAHLYLRDARANSLHGERRRAVIDACTAAEVAMTTRVLSKAGDTEYVRRILRNTRGATELYDLVCALVGPVNGVSRGRVMNELASPRNVAAHEGTPPTPDATSRAYEIALQIVRAYSPVRGAVRNRRKADRSASGAISTPTR